MIKRFKIWLLMRQLNRCARILNDYLEASAFDLSLSEKCYNRRVGEARQAIQDAKTKLRALGVNVNGKDV